jgi:2-(1,2-epoxy-1,2-dihydrophenyl)acetyl-CoA isomerase
MSLSLSCDIRLCSDKAKFVPAFGRIAFSGDFGGSYFLTKLVGFGRAREIYFTGEHIDAQRALELGIANKVFPDDELLDKGLEYCAKIASGPPAALARMKANFLRAEHARVDEALDAEALWMTLSGWTQDHREGVSAFLEKRDPNFTGD